MTSRLNRLIAIDAHIAQGRYPGVETLCSLFEVQPRTIHQDIKELRERFNLNIQFDRARRGYYNADPSRRLPPMALTTEQRLLALCSIEMLCHFGGASFVGMLSPVVDAVVSHDPSDPQARLSEVVSFNPPSSAALSATNFVELLQACLNKEEVILSTAPASAPQQVLPRKLHFTSGAWSLIADANGGELRLPLSRINRVERLCPISEPHAD